MCLGLVGGLPPANSTAGKGDAVYINSAGD